MIRVPWRGSCPFPGAPGVAAQFKPRAKDIETEIRRAPGFIAYYMLDTPDGITTITVCQDRAGCDESSKLAAKRSTELNKLSDTLSLTKEQLDQLQTDLQKWLAIQALL